MMRRIVMMICMLLLSTFLLLQNPIPVSVVVGVVGIIVGEEVVV